jgi:replication factor C subunit 2/4
MELYSNTTRFALACNISTKIIEPIQSRCAILRFSRLSNEQVVERVLTVMQAEKAGYSEAGIEALVFTAEGDMRNALNNLQATVAGFDYVNDVNVYKVCDQPHPVKVQEVISLCLKEDVYGAQEKLVELYNSGYSSMDIIGTLFKVVKFYDMPEEKKLDYIKEIGFTNMRISDGTGSLLQLVGLIARLCQGAP